MVRWCVDCRSEQQSFCKDYPVTQYGWIDRLFIPRIYHQKRVRLYLLSGNHKPLTILYTI